MTYKQFKEDYYRRTLKRYPNYEIDNKGNVFNRSTNYKLTRNGNKTAIWVNGKNKCINVANEMLKTFPDIEFTKDDFKEINKNAFRKRGIYPWSLGKKKWRSIISVDGRKQTIGYHKTKQEAYEAFQKSFLLIRGYRAF